MSYYDELERRMGPLNSLEKAFSALKPFEPVNHIDLNTSHIYVNIQPPELIASILLQKTHGKTLIRTDVLIFDRGINTFLSVGVIFLDDRGNECVWQGITDVGSFRPFIMQALREDVPHQQILHG